MKIYLEMFLVFFKIGLFTIGGGYAMIPVIKKEIVDKKNWLSEKEFLDGLAVAQSSPGAMAINVSIFVGSKIKGKRGMAVATIGSVLPSFIIILIVAIFMSKVEDNIYVIKIFKAVKPVVIGLILSAAISMRKTSGINKKNFYIPIIIGLLIAFLKVSPIIFIILGMIAGNYIYQDKKVKVSKEAKK